MKPKKGQRQSQVTSATSRFRGFLRDERGAVAMEYGVIVLLMGIAIVATLMSIGDTLRDSYYGEINTALESAGTADAD
ncbi:Flp family type IVb pilin [Roseibium limicola]|uniref:Flp family type IVb pilin n=1 Tax=Roseibium limicola TaxID=2816037 RepID=A0A939J725_9HYPH|nr:Flp family type IVb pilin [Roseibium limicola]MBO0347495.1 Flp family type IVb pilin [Roseibium limicola]